MLLFSEKSHGSRHSVTGWRRATALLLTVALCHSWVAMTAFSADDAPAPAADSAASAPAACICTEACDPACESCKADQSGCMAVAPAACICTEACDPACESCKADKSGCMAAAVAPLALDGVEPARRTEFWVNSAATDETGDGSEEKPFRYLNQARNVISGQPAIHESSDTDTERNALPGTYTVHIVGNVLGDNENTFHRYTDKSNAGHLKALAGQTVSLVGEGEGAAITPTDGNCAVLSVTGGSMTVKNILIHGFTREKMDDEAHSNCDSPAVFVWGGSLTLKNGAQIIGNYNSCDVATPADPSAGWSGGSAYVGSPEADPGVLIMEEGSLISGGCAAKGNSLIKFEKYTRFCGGVVLNNGKLEMTGGEITNNDGKIGAGVYVDGKGTIELSGTAKIHGNRGPADPAQATNPDYKAGVENNVYLANGRTILVGEGGFQGDAKVGVYCEMMPIPPVGKTLIAIDSKADDQKYLHSDIPTTAAVLKLKAEPEQIYLAYANVTGEMTTEGVAEANATVIFINTATGDRFETRSDAKGNFQTALPEGTYLVAAKNEDNTQSVVNQQPVVIGSTEVKVITVDPLISGALVIGEVLNGADGVANAEVILTDSASKSHTTTSVGGGVYVLAGLPQGEAHVSATATIEGKTYQGTAAKTLPVPGDLDVPVTTGGVDPGGDGSGEVDPGGDRSDEDDSDEADPGRTDPGATGATPTAPGFNPTTGAVC